MSRMTMPLRLITQNGSFCIKAPWRGNWSWTSDFAADGAPGSGVFDGIVRCHGAAADGRSR
jgi:hypothetical protein